MPALVPPDARRSPQSLLEALARQADLQAAAKAAAAKFYTQSLPPPSTPPAQEQK